MATQTLKVACECGRVWRLTKIKVIVRDKGHVTCICGKVLKEWNGEHVWTGTTWMGSLIRDLKPNQLCLPPTSNFKLPT